MNYDFLVSGAQMPKPINLTDIFSLLQQDPVEEKNHFLFLLGTDTVFTPRPTISLVDPVAKKSYERGETLSYAAQAVVSLLGEQEQAEVGAKNDPLSYCSPSVDVVNGPTTLGSEVGERIALGVYLALRAVANGKETLEIPCHSRGAVEATMVMSELKRIKKALQEEPHKPLHEILWAAPATEGDNTYIAEAMRKFFKPSENETFESRQKLLERLNNLKVNPFLIDPVPGGSKFGLKRLRWHSPRFYEEPDCNNYVLLLCRDERTCCFTPIVPKGMQPLIIPGHHGTASGNRYNQQGVEVPGTIEKRNTTGVQDLVLYKLFYFFNQCTNGRFNSDRCHVLNLEHESLDRVVNDFLQADEKGRCKQLLDKYLEIRENNDAYRYFTQGSYAWLGAQYAVDKQRFVHFRGHNHQRMEDVAPTLHEDFINQEHALLYLRNYIQFDELAKAPMHVMVGAVTTALKETIDKMLESTEMLTFSDNDAEIEEMASRTATKAETLKILRLLQNEGGRKIFFSGLSILIDTISQKYLRNNLSIEEDKALREVIEQPFRLLKSAKEAAAAREEAFPVQYKQILDQCDDMIQEGAKRTIEAHYNSTIQQADALRAQIGHRLAPAEHFTVVFQGFVENLTKGDNIPEKLALIQRQLREVKPVSIEGIQGAINDAISSLGELQEEELLTLKAFIASKQAEFLQPCFDAHLTSANDYLINLERLYKLARTLRNDYPSLQNLVSDKRIEVVPDQLHFRELALIEAGGALLKALVDERKIDLRQQPDCISQEFFMLIKQEAVKFGASLPEVEDLREQLTAQLRQIAKLEETIVGNHRAAEETRQSIENLRAKLLEASSALEGKNIEMGLQLQTIESLQRQVTSHAAQIERIRVETAAQIERAGQNEAGNRQTVKALLSKEEKSKALLIDDKLLPPTYEYLDHLLTQARKHRPELPNNFDNPLPYPSQDNFSSAAEKEAYYLIADKYNFVFGLKTLLEDTENYPLPSDRVNNFSEALQKENKLTIHRDEKLTRYLKTCFAVLGIIATGIIPGIAALAIYSLVSQKRNPLFFNHYTRGEEYIAGCERELDIASPSA
ncbi:hypothetical protein B6N58_12565 [Legionella micdadei]|nr:hypothetical protein B6N58_12565 [Legionella micdadei]